MAAYYIYLYLNFSGFCDVVIGASALIGITIDENFDNPFRARNVNDFWTRWHITLSTYLRDMVFTPLSKMLIRLTGPKVMPLPWVKISRSLIQFLLGRSA